MPNDGKFDLHPESQKNKEEMSLTPGYIVQVSHRQHKLFGKGIHNLSKWPSVPFIHSPPLSLPSTNEVSA